VACAGYLALEGVEAVLFEKRPVSGGLNTWGIAPYKLKADESLLEISWIERMGVEIRHGVDIGKDVTGAQLLDGYDAVFIGVGLGDDTRLGIPGEDGPGVVGAVAWIEEMKLHMKKGARPGRVVVVGGGNTAIDVARECAGLGAAEVSMVYRRGHAEMSGYVHEMMGARKERVRLVESTQPVAVLRDASGQVTGLRCVRTERGKNVAGTEHDIPCDLVAVAIGQSKLRAVAKELPGVALDARGCVVCDPATGRTGNPKVYAGGDCTNGGKEVVNAAADGRNAARTMLASFASSRGAG
jgi:glutamate synthase (NADPH/NADH) small chain